MFGDRRRLRVVLGGTALVLVLSALGVLPAGKGASGAPTGASPLVYVAASRGPVDAFTLADVASGKLVAAQSDNLVNDGVPSGAAITRDSTRTLVTASTDLTDNVAVINTSSGAVQTAFQVATAREGHLVAVAADPANASLAYVLTNFGDLYEVNIDTVVTTLVAALRERLILEKSAVNSVDTYSLALSANGTTAYVGASGLINGAPVDAVLELSLEATNPPVTVWSQPEVGDEPGVTSLALTPSGDEIFATDRGEVFGLHLPLSATEPAFDVVPMFGAYSVTVGPHGRNVYAGAIDANDRATVEGFPIGAPSHITDDSLQFGLEILADGAEPIELAAGAGGRSLVVTLTEEDDAGAPEPVLFDVSLGGYTAAGAPAMKLGPGLVLPGGLAAPVAVAVSPDQAPHAAFTSTLGYAGASSSFSAAASTVKYGSIASYRWDFGDGSASFTTSSDTATHVFASAGTYTVTLVETDSAGTTVPPAFPATPSSWVADGPGQTPYRLSSTLARAVHTVTIAARTHPTTSTTSTTSTTPTKPKKPRKPGKPPVLTLEPSVGPPGSVVTVTGRRFPNNATVTVEWSTANASSTAEKVKVQHGGFVVQLLVLVPDLLGPRQAIAVSYPKANRPTFLVVADSEEPGGPNATPVFRSEGP